MKEEIKVPSMGESITEAIIGSIIKPSGSMVQEEDEILEIETDKVNQVLYAQKTGVVTWNVETDESVSIGQVIGFIDSDAPVSQQVQKSEKTQNLPPKPQIENEGIRISKESAVERLKEATAKEKDGQKPIKDHRTETRQEMPKIRKLIAKRLVDAQHNTAMLTTFNEIDLSLVIALRERHKEQFLKENGVKLGFMSFFIKGVISALKAVPELNAYIDKDDIVQRHYMDISIAVGTEKGLIVPVLKDCDTLTFAEIEQKIAYFAKKARDGKISVDELQGGSFTITNGGVYGSLLSTPILNPPQSGILGMHKILNRPVAIDNQVVIRPMMYVALSYDHRIVDGKEAITFLVHLKNHLEDPEKLLLNS